jgi:DNA mismatch repair protein MutS2
MVRKRIKARVDAALDRAAAAGESALVVIHGLGTGALRDALRRHLAASPYVHRFGAAAQEDGGDGVTLVRLAP